ncbi:hypothetical protein [Sphingomonas bacterium]|uniref:hypothetical protein n=1 Tax=Sphingomonas bacterium TaxID=1895847 RepID=UPI0015775725|nr:hypothetical protein [Sphingomonas bacterium]
MKVSMALAGALLGTSVAQGQTVTPPIAQPAPAASSTSTAAPLMAGQTDTMLQTGARVPLKLTEVLTTNRKALRVGQHFNLETTEPLMVANQVVIPAGTPAVGEITDVKNKGMWGKSGRFVAQLLYLTYGGRQVRLTGSFDDKGHSGGVAAGAVSALAFLPAGFFMTGHSAEMPIGAPVTGFIGEDVPVAFAATPVAPLTVPGGAPIIVPAAAH